jgi:hypothetical protein
LTDRVTKEGVLEKKWGKGKEVMNTVNRKKLGYPGDIKRNDTKVHPWGKSARTRKKKISWLKNQEEGHCFQK